MCGRISFGFFFKKINLNKEKSEWHVFYFDYSQPDFNAIRKTCNMWRNYDDIQDSFDSVLGIIDYWAKDPYNMSTFAGPGGWNDPDEVSLDRCIHWLYSVVN